MEEKQIPSLLLNILFAQVNEIMGHRSLILLLRQAGLTGYIDYAPPLDDTPSITVGEYSRLLATIYRVFGPQSARPLFLRHGRLSTAELWRQRPTQLAVSSMALKLLPTAKRMQIVLDRFADQVEEIYGAVLTIGEESDAFVVEIGDCPYCAGIIQAGIIQAGIIQAGTIRAGTIRARITQAGTTGAGRTGAGRTGAGRTGAEMDRGQRDQHKPVTKPVCHVAAASLEEMIEWATTQPHLVEEVACEAMGDPVCRFRISK